MHTVLADARSHVDRGQRAIVDGDVEASEQALREAKTLMEDISSGLRELELKTTLLERDVGHARHPEGSPWRTGYRERLIGLQPSRPGHKEYLHGWEVANRLCMYEL